MSQIPTNNTYSVSNGTPLYTYQTSTPKALVTQQGQGVSVSSNNGNSQIYQYPTTSLYDTNANKQASSGVNIYIYNPSGIGGPSSNSTANASYGYPIPGSQTTVNNTVPQGNTVVANTPITTEQTTKTDEKQKTKKVVELTDDYIKTLENYLRSPDATVRKSGIKELINRYEEDESRYDDPALTALLNIALQDSDTNNRLFAMSPIASGSAHGDENTIKLLQNLQASDKLYGQEAKMANDALLNAAQTKVEIPDNSPEQSDKKNNE